MYFPYLRGRQYELLALKELVKNKLISKSIIPVVELVKDSSTLQTTLKTYSDKQHPIAFIINPSVGEFKKNRTHVNRYCEWFFDGSSIIPSVLMNYSTNETVNILKENNISTDRMLTVLNNRDFVEGYKNIFQSGDARFTLCVDERTIRREVSGNKVIFEDKFIKKSKNADYEGDEFFSDDHLYFGNEGYKGFSDYSIIGSDYSEGGFAPYAVAIHIVYFDQKDILRVAHFVSDSNDDTSDVAGKFYEAVLKLKAWFDSGNESQRTFALTTLLNHAENGYYPGLPTVKKLSIMHHLELMSKYLDGGL